MGRQLSKMLAELEQAKQAEAVARAKEEEGLLRLANEFDCDDLSEAEEMLAALAADGQAAAAQLKKNLAAFNEYVEEHAAEREAQIGEVLAEMEKEVEDAARHEI